MVRPGREKLQKKGGRYVIHYEGACCPMSYGERGYYKRHILFECREVVF